MLPLGKSKSHAPPSTAAAATLQLSAENKYTYTSIRDIVEYNSRIPSATTYNVYGVVVEYTNVRSTKGTDHMCSIVIVDESCIASDTANDANSSNNTTNRSRIGTNQSRNQPAVELNLLLYNAKHNLPHIECVGSILRLHRIKLAIYNNKLQGQVASGFDFLLLEGHNTASIAQHHIRGKTFAQKDLDRVEALRKWTNETLLPSKSFWTPRKNMYRKTLDRVRYDEFFDLVCMIVVAEADRHAVEVWDGTRFAFDSYNNVNQNNTSSSKTSIWFWDMHIAEALRKKKPGDWVKFRNVVAQTDRQGTTIIKTKDRSSVLGLPSNHFDVQALLKSHPLPAALLQAMQRSLDAAAAAASATGTVSFATTSNSSISPQRTSISPIGSRSTNPSTLTISSSPATKSIGRKRPIGCIDEDVIDVDSFCISTTTNKNLENNNNNNNSGDNKQLADASFAVPKPIGISDNRTLSIISSANRTLQQNNVSPLRKKRRKREMLMAITEHEDVPYSSIFDVLQSTADNAVFHCKGRVIGYSPSIEDFTHPICSHCRKTIPRENESCVSCATDDETREMSEVVWCYSFTLRITGIESDAKASEPFIDVCVRDKFAEQFFYDLPPCDLHSNETARQLLEQKLAQMLSHIQQTNHQSSAEQQQVEDIGSSCVLDISLRLQRDANEGKAFSLFDTTFFG